MMNAKSIDPPGPQNLDPQEEELTKKLQRLEEFDARIKSLEEKFSFNKK